MKQTPEEQRAALVAELNEKQAAIATINDQLNAERLNRQIGDSTRGPEWEQGAQHARRRMVQDVLRIQQRLAELKPLLRGRPGTIIPTVTAGDVLVAAATLLAATDEISATDAVGEALDVLSQVQSQIAGFGKN